MTEYLDFEIEIGNGIGREYPVAVIRSPGGEAREQMVFPFDELALDSRLKDLQIALLRSGGQRRLLLTPQEQTIQDFGQKLFTALMTGEVRSRYDVSQREASHVGKGLRIKLRIQSPDLACLPWEFMYDSRGGEYVCLSTQTPMVRYIEIPHSVEPLTVIPPLRILGLIAGPSGLALLDVENEKRRMEMALNNLITRDQVSVTWQEHVTWRDLQRVMRNGKWNIVHFIGHGGFDRLTDEGLVALEDEDGKPHLLPASQLARLLSDHPSLRLVVLNACEGGQGSNKDIFSSTASIIVRRGIPAVMAMQYAITDRAAVEFARGFYEAIADGLPVDAAVTEARKSISIGVTNTLEWGTPVLFMHTPDGVLFQPETAAEKAIRLQMEKQKREQAHREAEALKARLAAEKAAHEAAEKVAKEKTALEQTKREAEHLAMLKAEEEHLAYEKVEAEHKAREEAEKLSRAKAEREAAEREVARLKVEHEATEKTAREQTEQEAQHLAAEKAAQEKDERETEERVAREKVEVERKAKEEAQRLVTQKAEEELLAHEKAKHKAKESGIPVKEPAVSEKVGDHETGAPSADGIAPQEQMQSAMEENVAAKRPGITIFSRAEHIWKQWNAWKKGIVIIGIILCVVIPYLGFLILNRPLQPVQLILPGKNPATSPINARFAAVNKVAFSPDGKTLASVSSNYGLQLWNLGDGALMNIGENSDLYAVAFSPDGKYLAGGSGVDKIKVMDTTVGTFPIKFILNGHTDYVREVAFSPDRQFIIASGSADQTVRLWHFSESSLIKTILEGHTDAVNSVSFSSDGKYLASGSSDGSIRIWRVSDGALQRTITTAYYKESVAISPVAPILASGGSDGTILWNLDDGTKIMNLDSSHSYSVAFSPDGQKLASGGLDNTVLIWRVSDGVLLDTFKGHPAGIISAFFSPGINSVAFSPDGTLVASGSGDGTIRLWKISP